MAIVSLFMDSPRERRGPIRAHRAGLDSEEPVLIEPNECAAARVIDIDGVTDDGRVIAFLREALGLWLERRRRLDLVTNTQKQRTGVVGKALDETPPERDEVEARADHDRGHPGPTLRPGDGDAVDQRVGHAGTRGDRFGDLRGRHILALPPERVTDTVDEVEIAPRVPSHQVAGAEPGVARFEHAAENLFLRRLPAGVTLEAAAHARWILRDPADRLADFARTAANAESSRVTGGLVSLDIELHDRHRESMGEKRRNPADGAGLSLDVDQRDIAFGRRVELQDPWNAEAALEGVPHLEPQPIAAADPEPVLPLPRVRRAVHEVPTHLADVLEEGAIPLDDGVPEAARREALPEDNGPAGHQRRPGGHHAADAVVHRQAVVHPIAWARVHHTGEPIAPLHQPKMAHLRGFGQPGRARGIDVERRTVDGRPTALGLAQRLGWLSLDVAIDARELVAAGAVNPDLDRLLAVEQRSAQRLDELRGRDDVLGGDDIDAVGERGTGHVRIEQRNDPAYPRDPKPDRHVLGPVRHEQTYHVALVEALAEGQASISVRPLRELAIAQALVVGEERRRRIELLGELLDHSRENTTRTLRDRRRQLERPHPRRDGRTIVEGLHAVLPASTVITVPVMLFALSLRMNSTAFATSSMSGRRRSALRRTICCRCSASRFCVIAVSTKPGATELTVTARRPTSRASDRVKPIIDALVAA